MRAKYDDRSDRVLAGLLLWYFVLGVLEVFCF